MSSSLISSLIWRRALKSFGNSTGKPTIDVTPILEAARLAPTSFGIQPFHIHVVTNEEVKAKLKPVSYNQPQVVECSHLLIFTARSDAKDTVERYIEASQANENAASFFRGSIGGMDKASFLAWSTSQAL